MARIWFFWPVLQLNFIIIQINRYSIFFFAQLLRCSNRAVWILIRFPIIDFKNYKYKYIKPT